MSPVCNSRFYNAFSFYIEFLAFFGHLEFIRLSEMKHLTLRAPQRMLYMPLFKIHRLRVSLGHLNEVKKRFAVLKFVVFCVVFDVDADSSQMQF